jgi:hypothetical protein
MEHRRQIETIDPARLRRNEKKITLELTRQAASGRDPRGHCVCWQTAAMCCDWRPTVADKFWFLVLFAIAIEDGAR